MGYELIYNRVLIIPIVAWAAAQLLKTILILVRERRLDFRLFFSSGGMPSSHSAVVGSLAMAAGMIYGFGSAVFGVAAILAAIVMSDASGVRQSVGQQAEVLNRIMEELRFKRITYLERDLKEFIGHTQFQVIIGAFLGIMVAWVWVTVSNL